MKLNADFSQRVVIRPGDYHWLASPAAGVERMMLDRVGDEVARATSIVRYAPNSVFPYHQHGGGEEILVLSGVFADEHGQYPAGSYLRNPIGTGHSPCIGPQGAVILVKLHQFAAGDTRSVVVNYHAQPWQAGLVEGLEVISLHQFGCEQVALVKWAPNTQFRSHQHWGGEEIYVIEGVLFDEYGRYPEGSWIRSPHGAQHNPYSGGEGALIYVKVGHL